MSTAPDIPPEVTLSAALLVRGADLIALSGKLLVSNGPDSSARLVGEAKKHVDTISSAIAACEHTINAAKESLQSFADAIVGPEYRQPLKTIIEALDHHGWEHVDFPMCCGKQVDVQSFFGTPYFVQCNVCQRFARDVAGPIFEGGSVRLPDSEKINLDDNRRWIVGVKR